MKTIFNLALTTAAEVTANQMETVASKYRNRRLLLNSKDDRRQEATNVAIQQTLNNYVRIVLRKISWQTASLEVALRERSEININCGK